MKKSLRGRVAEVRRRAVRAAFDGGFHSITRVVHLHPMSQPERHRVHRIADVPYDESGHPSHRLDLYIPDHRRSEALPVVVYFHGGAFRILSKDTHRFLALAFARRGYLVVNVDYRLAPQHRFPAAISDACRALVWVAKHIEHYGGDLNQLIIAGESAGANLATAATIACLYPRSESFARELYETGIVPRVVIPKCGILQVTDTERFIRRRALPAWIQDILLGLPDSYLDRNSEHSLDLADPLLFLENAKPPTRPLPAFFTSVGTRDPLLDDTRRLDAALRRLGASSVARYFPGELHAFQAMFWRDAARVYWKELHTFLKQQLAAVPEVARAELG